MFELTSEQIEGLVDYKASYLPGQISASPAFRPAVGQHVSSLTRLAEPEVCARRKEFMRSALAADEFRERVLIEDGAQVVVGGIRFRNLDPGFPFVELNANFDLLQPNLVGQIASVARHHFGGFAPKGILAVGPPKVALSIGVERWSHAVCGPSANTCNALLPDGLTCSFPATAEFYDAYRDAYAQWQATSPGLGGFVQAEPRQDLEASAAQGLLASFADAAGWCGVVAARQEALYGTQALYIYEIFLVERWRGKGAAKAIDAALVSRLASRYVLVWENIHSENWPSLRVAFAQGRSVLETEYFLPYGEDGGEDGRLQVGS